MAGCPISENARVGCSPGEVMQAVKCGQFPQAAIAPNLQGFN